MVGVSRSNTLFNDQVNNHVFDRRMFSAGFANYTLRLKKNVPFRQTCRGLCCSNKLLCKP